MKFWGIDCCDGFGMFKTLMISEAMSIGSGNRDVHK